MKLEFERGVEAKRPEKGAPAGLRQGLGVAGSRAGSAPQPGAGGRAAEGRSQSERGGCLLLVPPLPSTTSGFASVIGVGAA